MEPRLKKLIINMIIYLAGAGLIFCFIGTNLIAILLLIVWGSFIDKLTDMRCGEEDEEV